MRGPPGILAVQSQMHPAQRPSLESREPERRRERTTGLPQWPPHRRGFSVAPAHPGTKGLGVSGSAEIKEQNEGISSPLSLSCPHTSRLL